MEDDYYAFKKLIVFGCAQAGKSAFKKALEGSAFEKDYHPSEKGTLNY